MLQKDFVDTFIMPFRYTAYATKSKRPDDLNSYSASVSPTSVFFDRSNGELDRFFKKLNFDLDLLIESDSPVMASFKLNPDFTSSIDVSVYFAPEVIVGLSILPQSPNLKTMINEIIFKRPMYAVPSLDEPMLVGDIAALELLNLISIWSLHHLLEQPNDDSKLWIRVLSMNTPGITTRQKRVES